MEEKLAIQITRVAHLSRTIAAFRRVEPDVSIAQLRARIAEGAAIVEYLIYRNDYVEVAARIHALVQGLHEAGATMKVFLLREDERLTEATAAEREISAEVLNNILASADEFL